LTKKYPLISPKFSIIIEEEIEDMMTTAAGKHDIRRLQIRNSTVAANLPVVKPVLPAEIHTSDRVLFKRCRRRWDWQSPIRQNLEPKEVTASALWFGTGFHFAMEDYHGYNVFGHPVNALKAYYQCFPTANRPPDADELMVIGIAIFNYYVTGWLPRRKEFKTLVVDGRPQVEVQFEVELPDRNATYAGTFDRVVVDPHQRLWVVDYKSVARFDTTKLETDTQISAYAWAASQIYGAPFEGVLYMQFVKAIPQPPQRLKNGEFSQTKQQKVTHALYRKALRDAFGTIPSRYVDFLNYLAAQEGPEGDLFIRRDLVRRNEHVQASEYFKILDEVDDMINPRLRIYTNPTRDCAWECPFRTPCIALDDGSDWESLIEMGYREKKELGNWRSQLRFPPDLSKEAMDQLLRPLKLHLNLRS
jgi:hypothetical protein